MEHGSLKIVGRQCVAGHETVHITVFHHDLHGASCICVKGKRRAHHPQDVSVLFLVFKEFEEPVVITGK